MRHMATTKRSKSSAKKSANVRVAKPPDQLVTGSLSEEPSSVKPGLRTLIREAIPVLPYQDRWIRDNSKLKIAVWSRQSGKSFAAALRAVIKCLEKRTQYIILSKGERQSRLFMEKVQDFCFAFKRLKALK